MENNNKPAWNAIFLSVFVNFVLKNGLNLIIKNKEIKICVILDINVIYDLLCKSPKNNNTYKK